jgi:hypothetical protein
VDVLPLKDLDARGVETIRCDLLDPAAVEKLPSAANVIFMAGRKFGSTGGEHLTWAINVAIPHIVARTFTSSRIAALPRGLANATLARETFAGTPVVSAYTRKMIEQIDQYWEKLFADPITVQTPAGPVRIQPQRTNNILEQFFRSLKRAHRRRTGNASSGRMLRTILAETPLVQNLQNPHYLSLLLNGKASLEELFADIEIDTLRKAFREAQDDPERIPAKLKPIIAMPDFPEKFLSMVEKAVA